MGKVESLKDIVEFNSGFKTAVNLYLNLNKTEKVLGYIPTKSSISFMNAMYLILNTLLNILGIDVEKKVDTGDLDVAKIEKLIEERTNAKKAKDFAKADSIRKELLDMGIELLDTRQGVKWKKV